MSFLATNFTVYKSKEFIKIDFFEQEPITLEDGSVQIINGTAQRITMPTESAKQLFKSLADLPEKDSTIDK